MKNCFEIVFDEIKVMCVEATGVRNSAKAFLKLESKLPSLRGRRFYGVLEGEPENGIYRACVKLELNDRPGKMGLKAWSIPGGKYARAKIKDWEAYVNEIAPTFKKMSELYAVDNSRPTIEFYRSQKELLLLLPIK